MIALAALGIIGMGAVAAWLVHEVLVVVERRYERRTGRDWTTGEPK